MDRVRTAAVDALTSVWALQGPITTCIPHHANLAVLFSPTHNAGLVAWGTFSSFANFFKPNCISLCLYGCIVVVVLFFLFIVEMHRVKLGVVDELLNRCGVLLELNEYRRYALEGWCTCTDQINGFKRVSCVLDTFIFNAFSSCKCAGRKFISLAFF
jgi:hypothetical protein